MVHLLYTPEQAVQSALGVVENQSTLARIVNQDFSSQFVPGRGATVTVVNPVRIDPARVYTKDMRDAEAAITYSELTQDYTSLTLTDQVYQAVKLPDDFTTFTVTDLGRQVIRPMGESVAEKVNDIVAAEFSAIPTGLTAADTAAKGSLVDDQGTVYTDLAAYRVAREAGTAGTLAAAGVGTTVAPTDLTAGANDEVLKVIRAAARLLNERRVSRAGRFLVVGAGWEAAIMSQELLNKANEAGNSDMLRRATLGTLYGFTIVADYTIDPYAAYALNREAVTLATRVTAAPAGVPFSAVETHGGFAMRYLQDYDPNTLRDRAVIDLFAGATLLDGQRVVRLTGTEGFEEPTAATAEPAA